MLLRILVAALLCARWLVPAEEAAQGATLWLVQLWPAALGLWAWSMLRTPGVRIRWGVCDVMLGLVVAGHVISATAVLLTEGQKRAAVNMLWEWVGLGIGFFLLRQLVVTRIDRNRLLLTFVAVMVALSGLGIWQHFVFYPQTRARYAQARNQLDGLLKGLASSRPSRLADRQRRIRQVTRELVQMGVPPEALNGRMRLAFESRLEASSEPFGSFALANTFAGFLAIGLILLVAAGRGLWLTTDGAIVRRGGWIGAIVIVVFCLLLTKSRTAWVGTVCGLSLLVGVVLRRRGVLSNEVEGSDSDRRPIRRWWLILPGAGAVLAVLLVMAISSGGLDAAVLTEAPKSLAYRMEYWRGSWAVVREHPWLGVGPGNFRQHYLQYKLPGSSEEIADPHNFLLGVWTSGGLIAVCGLMGLLVAWTATLRRAVAANDGTEASPKRMSAGDRASSWLWGMAFGFVLVLLFRAVLEDRFDVGLLFVLAGWLAVVAVFRGRSNSFAVSGVGVGAAVLAVMVHLLGAGGIEMPAVVQTILLLLAAGLAGLDRSVSVTDSGNANGIRQSGSWRDWLPSVATGVVAMVLFVSCLLTATRPVLERRAWMAVGDAEMSEGNRLETAERSYVAAAVADPLSPEPVDRLAELEFRKWRQSRRETGRFDRVVEFSQEAIRLDPQNWLWYRALGNRYREAFRSTHDSADAVFAVKYLGQALEHYPSNALLRAEMAEACSDAGAKSQALRHAEQAIRLDLLNRKRGHRDRLLPEKTRHTLKRILDPALERRH